jgi:L-alanine-DL-glutamate epimerase-like enolase superfamily enzyme
MRITRVSSVPISFPSNEMRTALGRHESFDYAVIEIETDEGIAGLGEISTIWEGQGHLQSEFVSAYCEPKLVGEDPLARTRLLSRIMTRFNRFEPAYAAIEMALLDIAGQALDTPVYNLLGGRRRDSVVLSRSIGMGSPNEMAAAAAEAVAEGFTCVKLKVGVDFEHDLEATARVREAVGPATTLRLDANMGWASSKEAIQRIKRLEIFELHSVEQPIPPGNLEELRRIRDAVDVPIMADESLWAPTDAWSILRVRAADMLNVYVAEAGGIGPARLCFEMGALAGVDCVIGAMPELGIGTAAAVHLAVSVDQLRHPCDACGVIYHEGDIINERFRVERGRIWPPEGPGLGVTLDRGALERYEASRSRGVAP